MNSKEAEVLALLKQYFGDNVAILAPMMANIHHETGGSFDFKQIPYERSDGTREDAHGLFQFNFHKPYYFKWLEESNLIDSAESQIKYVHEAIYKGKSLPSNTLGRQHGLNLQKLFEGSNYQDNHDYLLKNFFKPKTPHADRRQALLDDYYKKLSVGETKPTEKNPKYEEVLPSEEIRTISKEKYDKLPEGKFKDLAIVIDDENEFSSRQELNIERYNY